MFGSRTAKAQGGVDRLFDEVDDVGVPTGLELVLAQVREETAAPPRTTSSTRSSCGQARPLRDGQAVACRDEARSDEEEKERYREIAAKRLASERLAAHMNVERLAARLQREDDRDAVSRPRTWCGCSRTGGPRHEGGPAGPPVVLGRKALNQLVKRPTRKLAGPKGANDERSTASTAEARAPPARPSAQQSARSARDKLAAWAYQHNINQAIGHAHKCTQGYIMGFTSDGTAPAARAPRGRGSALSARARARAHIDSHEGADGRVGVVGVAEHAHRERLRVHRERRLARRENPQHPRLVGRRRACGRWRRSPRR